MLAGLLISEEDCIVLIKPRIKAAVWLEQLVSGVITGAISDVTEHPEPRKATYCYGLLEFN